MIGKDNRPCPAKGCPAACDWNEQMCHGGMDINGCFKPDYCIPYKSEIMGNDGYQCPAHCDQQCNEDEISCSKGRDSNGCEHPNYCMDRFGKFQYRR